MNRRAQVLGCGWLLLLALPGCEGREIAVFDLPAVVGDGGVGGSAGTSAVPAAGSSGMMNVGGGGAGAGGAGPDLGGAGTGGSAGLTASGAGGGGGTAAGSGGSGGAPVGTPCTSEAECLEGWRCEKPGCDAQVGTCEPPVVYVPPDLMPVCGCDGVTYWNDALRRQVGTTLQGQGECRATACACEVGADCNVPFASCSRLMPGDMCGHPAGACWLLPPECPAGAGPKSWQGCKPPEAGEPPPPCVDTCTAIASEKPHKQPHQGNMCK